MMASLPLNIIEQQAVNRRNTIDVMVMFTMFVGFLGCGLDLFIFGFHTGEEGGTAFPLPIATVCAIAFGGVSAWWGLQAGAAAVLGSCDAEPLTPGDPSYRPLENIVEEMSIASGLPKPKIYIIPDPDPNAFATGKDPEHASIAVTQGLLDTLSREELQGVIAHEMSHIRNYDTRMMTVVAALIGAVMLIADVGLRSSRFTAGRGSSSGRRGGGGGGVVLFVLWLVALILAPLLSRILAMAVSRQREFLADASGAELTRNPSALATALRKISDADAPTRSIKKGTAHLCIEDPLGREVNNREGFFANLLATHPPIEQRIAILRGMAYQHPAG